MDPAETRIDVRACSDNSQRLYQATRPDLTGPDDRPAGIAALASARGYQYLGFRGVNEEGQWTILTDRPLSTEETSEIQQFIVNFDGWHEPGKDRRARLRGEAIRYLYEHRGELSNMERALLALHPIDWHREAGGEIFGDHLFE